MLQEMELRRNHCLEEIKSIDQVMAGLRNLLQNNELSAQGSLPLDPHKAPSASGKSRLYAGMSVRWATLYLLAEHATKPLPTSEITSIFEQGGITSGSKKFSANVSAVLSGMVNQRKEVEQVEGGYRITAPGRQVWEAIKSGPQWLSRQHSGEKG